MRPMHPSEPPVTLPRDMTRHYIGIDPGANGGIAYTSPDGDKCAPLPDTIKDFTDLIVEILNNQGYFANDAIPTICFMEEPPKFVKAIPGASVFVMARNFGQMEGVLTAIGVPLKLVRPQAWQKAHNVGIKGERTTTAWKNKLKAEAQRLYPSCKVTLATADALLILNAAQRGHI